VVNSEEGGGCLAEMEETVGVGVIKEVYFENSFGG